MPLGTSPARKTTLDAVLLDLTLSSLVIDIIRNNEDHETHSKILNRNVVLKLCKPQAISITRSSKWALVLRKTSCTIRHRLTPAMTCSTRLRILAIIVFSALSAGLSSCPRGFFFG